MKLTKKKTYKRLKKDLKHLTTEEIIKEWEETFNRIWDDDIKLFNRKDAIEEIIFKYTKNFNEISKKIKK